VPCIYISNQNLDIHLKHGRLADIAPTLLSIMGIETPREMTGKNLIVPS
jgi:2,3-bisphosphoglycerate-independent phosphoglycerate mutase